MNPLTALLGRLSDEGLRLELRDGHIAVTPKDRLTPEIREEILRNRPDVLELLRIHGGRLSALFRDPPKWPPACGRSGPASEDWWGAVGAAVRLQDGREGRLRALSYDSRTGRLRCAVEVGREEIVVCDPEDIARVSEIANQGRTG